MNAFPRLQAIRLYQKVTGRRFLEHLDELNRTQWLSRDELLNLQCNKLHRLLEYAYEHVPYYHRLFDRVGFRPADVLTDLTTMRKIPILTKAIIRENFDDLLTADLQRRKQMSPLTTGGSTGHPLIFMQDSNFRDYVTADIHRHLGWAGWQLGQVHAYIWGANFEAKTSQSIRVKLMNWALNRFVTNAYVLSEQSMSAFATQVRHRRPRILFGYPSSLYRFAEFVREHGFDDIKFDAIFASAEVLYPAQRQFIGEVFGGRMFNRYGTRELGGISCECEAHTGLHASIEDVYIEILKDGQPAKAKVGDIIVTNLNNYGMPFIRYSVEDMGAWRVEAHCPCGRELPMMDLALARRVDMFKTRDGRSVWGGFASPMFGMKGVKRFQLVQKSLDHVVARIVKDADLDEARLSEIERTVKMALGDNVNVEFEFPDEIAVYGSGKYRYAICEIDEPHARL
ncbi:MAG: phenylacetate--CoA ligase family protein [Anaerolineales bacterium]|nr:MAG: phenylacetate--CoA ligase family protein [Anaerolineales bacterium]